MSEEEKSMEFIYNINAFVALVGPNDYLTVGDGSTTKISKTIPQPPKANTPWELHAVIQIDGIKMNAIWKRPVVKIK
jgi:hypothetical protein